MKRAKAVAAVDARRARFREWFVAQYGPHPGDPMKALVLMHAADKKAAEARFHLREIVAYNDRWDSALQAWNAARTQRQTPKAKRL
jgi:hypothetical protein